MSARQGEPNALLSNLYANRLTSLFLRLLHIPNQLLTEGKKKEVCSGEKS